MLNLNCRWRELQKRIIHDCGIEDSVAKRGFADHGVEMFCVFFLAMAIRTGPVNTLTYLCHSYGSLLRMITVLQVRTETLNDIATQLMKANRVKINA